MGARAYGQSAAIFTGASGPEASTYAALLLALAMLTLALRRRRVRESV